MRRLLAPPPEPTDELAAEIFVRGDAEDPDELQARIEAGDLGSILREAGGDLELERDLVNRELLRIAWAERMTEVEMAPSRAAIERHRAFICRTEEAAGRIRDYFEARLRDWRLARGDAGKSRTHQFPAGSVGLAQSRAHTEVSEDAVRALAAQDETLLTDGCVRIVLEVSRSQVRKRFALRGGTVVDTATGEVVPPVRHLGPDGEELVSPVLRETKPATDRLIVTIAAGLLKAGKGE